MYKLYHGNCLEVMPKLIKEGIKIDAIIADPPYGTTACEWDSVIPFDKMWERIKRIRKDRTAIVLFGSEPFSSYLRMSNIEEYKYDWIWKKNYPTGMAFAKYQPMRVIENIIIFSKNKTTYNLQLKNCANSVKKIWKDGQEMNLPSQVGVYSEHMINKAHKVRYKVNPINFLDIKCVNRSTGTLHPTQKPVALMEYLIKTYTNENDLILDFTMGSGTTGVAALKLSRNFIGIEIEEESFKTAEHRIKMRAKFEKRKKEFNEKHDRASHVY